MGHSRSLEIAPFESLSTVSYSPSVITMAVYCIVLEIKRDIVRNSRFFHTPCIRRPRQGGSRRNINIAFGSEKLEWSGYAMVKKV